MLEKIYIFGAGKYGKYALEYYGHEKVKAFIDNNKELHNKHIYGKDVISFDEYVRLKCSERIVIAISNSVSAEKQLSDNGVNNYDIYLPRDKKVSLAKSMSHSNWIEVLEKKYNIKGMNVLEIGSRVVTGANYRNKFKFANYIGFDYHPGENVDIVGDAHKIDEYFEYGTFDLIFSSAVFEHLAMPWIVTPKIAKLLKVGGHVFIETHYSYSSHERPWHFFQFSEEALKIMFPAALGFECIEAGVSNPLVAQFAFDADDYLKNLRVGDLYCHSEYFGKKLRDVYDFDWREIAVEELLDKTDYPIS